MKDKGLHPIMITYMIGLTDIHSLNKAEDLLCRISCT